MSDFTDFIMTRIKTALAERNMSEEDLFVSLEINHGWRRIDFIRWVKYGQLSILKLRDLAEALGCSMEYLAPLPEGASSVRINCGPSGCRTEVVYPAGHSGLESIARISA